MKKILIGVVLLMLSQQGCSETKTNITEVGNPKTTPSAIELSSAVVSVITQSIAGSLFSLEGGQGGGSGDGYSCTYDDTSRTVNCTCPGGGSIRKVYSDPPTITDADVRFATNAIETYGSTSSDGTTVPCRITSCDVDLDLSGTLSSTYTGRYNSTTGSDDLTITQESVGYPGGMQAGEVTFGFDITYTTVGLSSDLAGTICIGSDCTTFQSIEDLQGQIDPNNTCPGGFDDGSTANDPGADDDQGAGIDSGCMQCVDDCEAAGGGDTPTCTNQCKADGLCD